MIYPKDRYKELIATQDQGLLFLILEQIERTNELLANLSGAKLTPESEQPVIEKPKMGRPKKQDQEVT